MYKVMKMGYVIGREIFLPRFKALTPTTRLSKLWRIWRTTISRGTCTDCMAMNGRIFARDEPAAPKPPLHPNCKCRLEPLIAIVARTATQAGRDGVDLYVARHGRLPDYYITQEQAEAAGWDKKKGNLAETLSGRLIGGSVYLNINHLLPDAPARIWYEADFDYTGGSRNRSRLLFSNDGLLFVTYDHYHTFYPIEGVI